MCLLHQALPQVLWCAETERYLLQSPSLASSLPPTCDLFGFTVESGFGFLLCCGPTASILPLQGAHPQYATVTGTDGHVLALPLASVLHVFLFSNRLHLYKPNVPSAAELCSHGPQEPTMPPSKLVCHLQGLAIGRVDPNFVFKRILAIFEPVLLE